MSGWLDILRRHAEATTNAAVAERLGVSRTLVSLVLAGKYDKSTARLEKLVLALLPTVSCPYLGDEIERSECDRIRLRPIPQSNPDTLRHWQACRSCAVHTAALSLERKAS